MWKRIQKWFLSKRTSAALALADQWQRKSRTLIAMLAADKEQLTELHSQLQSISLKLEADLREAESVERQHATAMDAIRAENKILSESTVPTLVAMNRLILQRVEADTAIQVRKQVAAGQREEQMI